MELGILGGLWAVVVGLGLGMAAGLPAAIGIILATSGGGAANETR